MDLEMPVDARSLAAHIDAVRALARALLGDEDAAEDVAQDAAVIALESGASVQSPRGWFAGVARNLSRRKIRDRTRRRRREHAAARPEAQADAAELVGRANEQRRVLDHLVQLEDPYRDVLLLRFFEGLPPREIARRRSTPVETVRTQVRRGIQRLRDRLETELRTDGRTWRQGLALAAGLGREIARAPGAVLSKVAMAAGVLLAVGGTVWWAFDTLEGSAPLPPEDDVVADADLVAVTPDDAATKKPATLQVPDWVPTTQDEPRPVVEPKRVPVSQAPAPAVATPEAKPRKKRPDDFWTGTPERPRRQGRVGGRAATARGFERISPPFVAVDGGMVKLPRAQVFVGSNADWAGNFAVSGEARSLVGVAFEAPSHARLIEEQFIDLFEVTNAQYELYLQDVAAVERFQTGDGDTRSLSEVVSYLWGPEPLAVDAEVAARQLYDANAVALMEAIPSRVVRDRDGQIDHERTFQAFYRQELPRGIPLEFFSRPIPPEWPGMQPAGSKRDHPVVGLSYAEVVAFAEWAGKHVPSEFTWEYAARGPNAWPWPWGTRARNFKERVNGGYNRPRDDVPDTAPVHTFPAGRSPFGCYHMLGNASEWTSSRLRSYPTLERSPLSDGFDRLVIRGGAANNRNQGAVRPMFRGWEDPRRLLREGSRAHREAEAVPAYTPFQRVSFAGFRCAWFEDVGRSRTHTMRQRLSISSRIPPAAVDADHFAALESTDLAADGAQIAEGKFVEGPAQSLVLQPLTIAITHRSGGGLGVLQDPNLVELEQLQQALGDRPLYLGLFHTDWPLALSRARVWPADREQPGWYGQKELTGTYVVYYAKKEVWLWHLHTGRQFRLGRASFQLGEGAKPFTQAESKVILRAEPVRRSLEGRVQLRLQVPYSTSTDARHLWLDVSVGFDVDRPRTDRPLRQPLSGGR